MTKDTLFAFIKRLLANGTIEKSELSLKQLKEILELQNTDLESIKIVDKAIESIPEASVFAINDTLNEDNLDIAAQRAANRKRREAQITYRGRC